jgi:hypothetical protein
MQHVSALARTAALALGALGLLAASGCSGPCSTLSEQVCQCRPSRPEIDACVQQVRLSRASKPNPSIAEEAVCEAILDSGKCTCDAVARGELAACGLAPTSTN